MDKSPKENKRDNQILCKAHTLHGTHKLFTNWDTAVLLIVYDLYGSWDLPL